MKEKEFNLSEKREEAYNLYIEHKIDFNQFLRRCDRDVKEFIRKETELLEDLRAKIVRDGRQMALFNDFFIKRDTLAGDELSK